MTTEEAKKAGFRPTGTALMNCWHLTKSGSIENVGVELDNLSADDLPTRAKAREALRKRKMEAETKRENERVAARKKSGTQASTKQKTILDWLKTIPDEQIREAAVRLYNPGFSKGVTRAGSLYWAIIRAFHWRKSKEGYDFWQRCADAALGKGPWPKYPINNETKPSETRAIRPVSQEGVPDGWVSMPLDTVMEAGDLASNDANPKLSDAILSIGNSNAFNVWHEIIQAHGLVAREAGKKFLMRRKMPSQQAMVDRQETIPETPEQRDERIKALFEGYIAKGGPITKEQLTDEVDKWLIENNVHYYASRIVMRDGEPERGDIEVYSFVWGAAVSETHPGFWTRADAEHAKMLEDGKAQTTPITLEQAKLLRNGDSFYVPEPNSLDGIGKVTWINMPEDRKSEAVGGHFTRDAAQAALDKQKSEPEKAEHKLPELPSWLPPLPEGYIQLGYGGTFKVAVEGFNGCSTDKYDPSWEDAVWSGTVPVLYFSAPINSKIAHLNYPWLAKKEDHKFPYLPSWCPPLLEGDVPLGFGGTFKTCSDWDENLHVADKDCDRLLWNTTGWKGCCSNVFYAAPRTSKVAKLNYPWLADEKQADADPEPPKWCERKLGETIQPTDSPWNWTKCCWDEPTDAWTGCKISSFKDGVNLRTRYQNPEHIEWEKRQAERVGYKTTPTGNEPEMKPHMTPTKPQESAKAEETKPLSDSEFKKLVGRMSLPQLYDALKANGVKLEGIGLEPKKVDEQSVLEEAAKCVTGPRRCDYGTPDENFGLIASLWSVQLKHEVTPMQVAMCLILLKVARQSNSPKRDNLVDIAGYAQCASELKGAK